MTSETDLIERAAAFLGVPVRHAGIFSAGSAITASIAGAAGGATAGEIIVHGVEEGAIDDAVSSTLGDAAGGIVAGASAVAGARAAREAAAAAEGMTPAILVALTDSSCVIMDWNGDAGSGTGPTRVIHSLVLADTDLEFGKIGVNRKVTMSDGDTIVSFTGALGLLSSGKEGKRDVLRALGHPQA